MRVYSCFNARPCQMHCGVGGLELLRHSISHSPATNYNDRPSPIIHALWPMTHSPCYGPRPTAQDLRPTAHARSYGLRSTAHVWPTAYGLYLCLCPMAGHHDMRISLSAPSQLWHLNQQRLREDCIDMCMDMRMRMHTHVKVHVCRHAYP